jgi:hypothetical protein
MGVPDGSGCETVIEQRIVFPRNTGSTPGASKMLQPQRCGLISMNVSACPNRQQGSSDRFLCISFCLCPGITENYRRWVFYSCVALLLVSIVWWLLAHRTSPMGSNGRVDVRAGANQSGHIQAAGRDAIHTVHHHYQSHAEPHGTRIDVSVLSHLSARKWPPPQPGG